MSWERSNGTGSSEPDLTIGSVRNAIDILEVLQEADGARNVDVVERTSMSKGSVHKYLRTLHEAELLTKEDGVYHLSFRFLDFGEFVREKIPGATYIREALGKLTEETHELAYFMMEEHGRAIIVFRRQGRESVNTRSRAGKRLPMHQNAGGKAMLAYEAETFVDSVVDRHDLPAATENTITDRDDLFAELETIREQGYALNEEESSRGIHAVSAPVLGVDDEVLGSCSVVGPKHRLAGEAFREELPDLLLTVTNELSLNLKYA